MSRYTTMVRYIVENAVTRNSGKIKSPLENCTNAAPLIFDFDFPIWSEEDRRKFEADFLMKYYMREIGLETVSLWKLYLQNWLNTNMPYWNMRMNAILKGSSIDFFMKNPNSFTDIYTGADDTSDSGRGESEGMSKYYEVPSRDIETITDHLNNATGANNSNNYQSSGHKTTNHTLSHKTEATPGTIDIWLKYKGAIDNTYKDMLDSMCPLFMGVY